MFRIKARFISRAMLAAVSMGAMTSSPVLSAAQAMPQLSTSQQFGEPMSEAVKLVKNRKYAEALAKVDHAAPFAKSRQEKLSVEQMKTAIYSGLGRTPDLIRSLEAQLEIGGLPAATIKAHRQTLAGLYSKQNNDAKAAELTRAIIKDYGGSPDQYAFIAGYDLKAKRYSDAVQFAGKAISTAKTNGHKPKEAWRQIIMRAEFERGNLPAYYAAVEQAAGDYPKPEYLRILIERAQKADRFNDTLRKLDVYRALEEASVSLSASQRADMAERAYTRGLPWEAADIFRSLAASGFKGLDVSKAERFKRMYAQVQLEAKAKPDQKLGSASRGQDWVKLGEAWTAAGEHRRAAEAINKGLASGDLDAGEADYARLQLGIAQYHADQTEAARKTWASIKSNNGSAELARVWRLMSGQRLA